MKFTIRNVHVMCDLYCMSTYSRSSSCNTLFSLFGNPFLSSGIRVNMPTTLEIARLQKIAEHREMLADIQARIKGENNTSVKQIGERAPGHKSVPKKRKAPPKKHIPLASDGKMEESRPTKQARSETPQLGLRRSSRNVGKAPLDYQAESQTQLPRLVARKIGVDHDGDPDRRSGK